MMILIVIGVIIGALLFLFVNSVLNQNDMLKAQSKLLIEQNNKLKTQNTEFKNFFTEVLK